jgi:hypothetical protein
VPVLRTFPCLGAALQVADRIRKHMVERVPRLLPAEVEDRVKDFASNVEGLVDKVVSGGWSCGVCLVGKGTRELLSGLSCDQCEQCCQMRTSSV